MFVLGTDTVFICGYDMPLEVSSSVLRQIAISYILVIAVQCQIRYILYILQITESNSAIIDKPNRRYNSISNGKPPNIILLRNW